MKNNSGTVLFDDVFFNLANSGIARVWRSTIGSKSFKNYLGDHKIEFIILDRSGTFTDSEFTTIPFPEYDRVYPEADRILIDQVVSDLNVDVFVSSYYTFSHLCKSLFVIYDLIPEKYGFQALNRQWNERLLGILAADNFFSISQSTSRDLMMHYPFVDIKDIITCNPGVDFSLFKKASPDEIREFKSTHNLDRYVVWVGGRTADYKNSKIVFEALNSRKFDFTFVFVGGDPFSKSELASIGRMSNHAIHLELDDEELVRCLSGSLSLVYPSKYEGFGLPPLEALALGVPVVTTLEASLPESVGALSIVTGSNDSDSFSSAVQAATESKHREYIAIEGPKWAEKFNWDFFSRTFVDSIIKTLESPSPYATSVRSEILEYSQQAQRLPR